MADLDKTLMKVSMTSGGRMIIPPVRNPRIRHDGMGSGDFMANRGKRKHPGLDLEIDEEGQDIIMPLKKAIVIREFFPYYGVPFWRGVEVGNEMFICKIHYSIPIMDLIGKEVPQGEVIAHAQDISRKYSYQMKKHIHWECFLNLTGTLPKQL